MFKYIMKRIAAALVTIWIVVSLTWFMMQAIPGDPFMNEKRVIPELKEQLRAHYGLDKPLVVQYGLYLKNFLKGDMGMSFQRKDRTVNTILAEGFPYSASLGLRAIIVGFTLGLLLGIVAALNHGKGWDRFSIFVAIIGVSIPAFVVAATLQYFVGVKLRLLPVAQWKGFEYTIMPTFALALGMIAQVARFMRSSMLDVLGQDYVKTAKAKGLSTLKIVWSHEIRNAILPVITILGPWIAFVLTGSFVVETIFAIPGIGKFYVQSINTQDYPLITGMTAFVGAMMVFMNLLVDILYGLIDPRIRIDSSSK
ncbi:MAG: ABC transporter permease [Caulobacteraceae bacterium]